MRLIKFLSIIFCLSFLSCKDKTTETVAPKTKKELFAGTTSKSYKSTKAEAVTTNGLKIDLVSSQPPCYVDNILTIFANGTFEIREGASKCATSDPDLILKTNWTISTDEKYLNADKIIFAGFTFEKPQFEILELTETKFVGKSKLKIKPTPQSAEQEVELTATFEVAK